MLSERKAYHELGADYYNQRNKEAKLAYLTRQLEKLIGGTVHVEFQPEAA
jgi:hypothetical protein